MNRIVYGAIAAYALIGIAYSIAATDPILPNPNKTPGATDPKVTQATIKTTICRKGGYTASVRDVDSYTKKEVFLSYGITDKPHVYEVDHLISLELGGTNAMQNLWPQSYVTTPYNANVKDKLEDKLHAMVCSGKIRLENAQFCIRSNWIKCYNDLKKQGEIN